MTARYQAMREEYTRHLDRARGTRALMLDEAARFVVANPLSTEDQLRVEHLVYKAHHLCCAQGYEALNGFLPEIWAAVISAWAELALGHTPPYPSLVDKKREIESLWRACSSFSTARALVEQVL